ncbi:MAG: signal peptidase II [Anaerolineales bacterium]
MNEILLNSNNEERKNPDTSLEEEKSKLRKSYLTDVFYLLFIAGVIVLLDYFTKALVRETLSLGESWMPLEWLAPYARIVHWQNSGAAFGMFQSGGLIFTGLAIVVSIFIIFYFPQVPKEEWALRLAMGMQLGGALGNLVDRLRYDGYVTDFISVGDFPVFNVADSSITVGVIVLLLGVWLSERKLKKESEEEILGD